jgi:AcrR family transcriptional regulator
MEPGDAEGPVRPARARPRRSPSPEERQADAERSRRLLLAAALEEFAAKGFAGARVQEIADRAGVNKQLINYYFGGKEGLYVELCSVWRDRKDELIDSDLELSEMTRRFLHDALTDSRYLRLLVWQALSEASPPGLDADKDQFGTYERRMGRELADDLDPSYVRLLLTSAVIMPAVMPTLVRRMFGLSPDDPEFEHRYADQLHKIIRRLG